MWEPDLEDWVYAYDVCIASIMRQQGKTIFDLVEGIDRSLSWDTPQLSVFAMQTGSDAEEKVRDEWKPMLEASKLAPFVDRELGAGKINIGGGKTAVYFDHDSGLSIIKVVATNESAGHGPSNDLVLIDEAWAPAYVDDTVEQALFPTMTARPHSQAFINSVAGTASSVWWRQKVEEGRLASMDDKGTGIAYLEYSIPEDADIYSLDVWRRHMPALGETVTVKKLESLAASLSESSWRRMHGNQWTGGTDLVIPLELWARVVKSGTAPREGLAIGIDMAQDRASGAIAIASADGKIEIQEHEQGTGWIIDEANRLGDKYGAEVALDGGGPIGALADNIGRARKLNNREVQDACGDIFDEIVEGRVRVRPYPSLDDAVEGVVKKEFGDRFVWSRKASAADVTPFMAATVALYAAKHPQKKRKPKIRTYDLEDLELDDDEETP